MLNLQFIKKMMNDKDATCCREDIYDYAFDSRKKFHSNLKKQSSVFNSQ